MDLILQILTRELWKKKWKFNTNNYFTNPSQEDIWKNESNTNKKGFRIRGTFGLSDITSGNAISHIGVAQNDKHTIKYKYIRHNDVNSTVNKEITNNVYIDTLTNDPSITGTPTQTAGNKICYIHNGNTKC